MLALGVPRQHLGRWDCRFDPIRARAIQQLHHDRRLTLIWRIRLLFDVQSSSESVTFCEASLTISHAQECTTFAKGLCVRITQGDDSQAAFAQFADPIRSYSFDGGLYGR
jgi:hypothetical protein